MPVYEKDWFKKYTEAGNVERGGEPEQDISGGMAGEIENKDSRMETSETCKKDAGKAKISLVPPAIIEAIAKVREYGTEKYGDPQNWKKVSRDRYLDAFLRHALAEMKEPGSIDDESGLPHCWHAACNLAFMIQIDSAKSESYRGFVSK